MVSSIVPPPSFIRIQVLLQKNALYKFTFIINYWVNILCNLVKKSKTALGDTLFDTARRIVSC